MLQKQRKHANAIANREEVSISDEEDAQNSDEDFTDSEGSDDAEFDLDVKEQTQQAESSVINYPDYKYCSSKEDQPNQIMDAG